MSEKRENRQVARTRRMLQSAFLDLIQKRPYSQISISDIADHADLARSTFYAHFETKDSLLLSFIDRLLDRFFEILNAHYEQPQNRELDIEINIKMFRLWKESTDIGILLDKTDIDKLIVSRLKVYWKRDYEGFRSRAPYLNPVLAGYLSDYLAYSFFSLLRSWTDNEMKHPPEVMGKLLYELTGPDMLKRIVEEFMDLIE